MLSTNTVLDTFVFQCTLLEPCKENPLVATFTQLFGNKAEQTVMQSEINMLCVKKNIRGPAKASKKASNL